MEYKCLICVKNYKSYKCLWNHNKFFHPKINIIKVSEVKDNNDKIICQYCYKTFTRKNNLNYHVKNYCKQKNSVIQENKILREALKNLNDNVDELRSKLSIIDQNQKLEPKITINKNNFLEKDITIIKDDIKKMTETYPINNQLINIIMDKNKTIEEMKDKPKNIILKNVIEINNEIINSNPLIYNNININSRLKDNYINANQMCQAENKNLNDWFSLESTKEIVCELSYNTNISESELIDNLNNNEVWIHPDLAIQLSQWVSLKFTLQISKWIRTLFSNEYIDVNIKLIKDKEKEIKLLRDIYLKKQQRKNYPDKNVIYILTTEENKNKRIYIIGKAKILKNRLSTYNKTTEHEVVYYKKCQSKEHMSIAELIVLNKLDEYREKANRDRFILPFEKDISFFTSIIDQSINYL
jgi:hypothetical protein